MKITNARFDRMDILELKLNDHIETEKIKEEQKEKERINNIYFWRGVLAGVFATIGIGALIRLLIITARFL